MEGLPFSSNQGSRFTWAACPTANHDKPVSMDLEHDAELLGETRNSLEVSSLSNNRLLTLTATPSLNILAGAYTSEYNQTAEAISLLIACAANCMALKGGRADLARVGFRCCGLLGHQGSSLGCCLNHSDAQYTSL